MARAVVVTRGRGFQSTCVGAKYQKSRKSLSTDERAALSGLQRRPQPPSFATLPHPCVRINLMFIEVWDDRRQGGSWVKSWRGTVTIAAAADFVGRFPCTCLA